MSMAGQERSKTTSIRTSQFSRWTPEPEGSTGLLSPRTTSDSQNLLGLVALLVGFGTVLAGGVAAAAGLVHWLSSLGDNGE